MKKFIVKNLVVSLVLVSSLLFFVGCGGTKKMQDGVYLFEYAKMFGIKLSNEDTMEFRSTYFEVKGNQITMTVLGEGYVTSKYKLRGEKIIEGEELENTLPEVEDEDFYISGDMSYVYNRIIVKAIYNIDNMAVNVEISYKLTL